MHLPTETLNKEMIEWRHNLHKFPELGFKEIRTAKFISKLLTGFGLKVYNNFGKTGVVGHLEKNKNKQLIAIRADMDALPIIEETALSYQSQNTGAMHACGHDGHMATLLGAAGTAFQRVSNGCDITCIFAYGEYRSAPCSI